MTARQSLDETERTVYPSPYESMQSDTDHTFTVLFLPLLLPPVRFPQGIPVKASSQLNRFLSAGPLSAVQQPLRIAPWRDRGRTCPYGGDVRSLSPSLSSAVNEFGCRERACVDGRGRLTAAKYFFIAMSTSPVYLQTTSFTAPGAKQGKYARLISLCSVQ